MTTPSVSVLIPCYNAERYIGETLESVLRQTWENIEVVVVDDGSEDNSVREVERFRTNVLMLLRQPSAGAAVARNLAYRKATGDYIQFLDADDVISPDKIASQVTRLISHTRCVATGRWGRFFKSVSDTRFNEEDCQMDLDPVDWLVQSRREGLGMLFPALWLIPRKVAEAAGPWNETLTLGDDGEYFTRVVLAAQRVLFCSEALCHYRSGITNSLSRRRSPAAWISALRVLELCESHVRAREDSERVRRGFALSWQHLAHASYPYHRRIAKYALKRAKTLHPVTIKPGGGPAFHMASRLIGWRLARMLQVASGRP